MKIPKAFETALQNKEELVLIASANPLLCNSNLESLWELEGFTLRAAFCHAESIGDLFKNINAGITRARFNASKI